MTTTDEPGVLETDAVAVRDLRAGDLPALVRIDAQRGGRRRAEYFQRKVDEVTRDARLHVSLVAELEGATAGFLLARLYYGELGIAEPTAVIDSVGVDPAFARRRVGSALLRQLFMNLRALGVEAVRTEVAWDAFDLLAFLGRAGFRPAPRLCLERRLLEGDP